MLKAYHNDKMIIEVGEYTYNRIIGGGGGGGGGGVIKKNIHFIFFLQSRLFAANPGRRFSVCRRALQPEIRVNI